MKSMTQRKQYGIILISISIFMFFVITAFTLHIIQLNSYLHEDCNLPANICPFTNSMPAESLIGYMIDAALGIFGVYLFFSGAKLEGKKEIDIKKLEPDEKKLLEMISSQGAIFQSELVEKSGGDVVEFACVIELGFLNGRDKLKGREIFSLVQY